MFTLNGMRLSNSSRKKNGSNVSIRFMLSAINVVFNFILLSYVLILFGANEKTDLLFLTIAIVEFVKSVIAANIINVFTPKIVELQKLHSTEFNEIFSSIFIMTSLCMLLFTGLVIYLASFFLPLYLAHIPDEFTNLGKTLLEFQLFALFFTFINSLSFSKINAERKYIKGDISLIFGNVIALGTILLLGKEYGIVVIAWSFLVKELVMFIAIFPRNLMYKSLITEQGQRILSELWVKLKPLIISTTYYKSEILIDRFILSMSNAGQLSLYLFSYQLIGASVGVLQRVVKTPMLTNFSEHKNTLSTLHARQKFDTFIIKGVIIISVLLLLFLIVGKYIILLLPEFGKLNHANIDVIWTTLIMLSGVFFGGTLGYITTSVFHAYGETKLFSKFSIVIFSVAMPIKILSFMTWGTHGLAIATSVYYTISFIIQVHLIRTKILK